MKLPMELQAAVEKGWKLFPCAPKGKEPVRGLPWRKEATCFPSRLADFALKYPGCNWGLATGIASGLVVLDADGEQGRANYAALGLPPTLTVRTGRRDGGEHHYFRLPAREDVRNATGDLPDGIHVRGTGGYVIYPSSIHDSGARYEFQPFDGDIPEAPPSLLARLCRAESAALPASEPRDAPPVTARERAYAWEALAAECAKFKALPSGKGKRNTALNRAAFATATMAASGWIDAAIAWNDLWKAAAAYRKQDGDGPVEATMQSGWDAGMGKPRACLGEREDNPPASRGGDFFSVDRRTFNRVCDAADMNMAVAYLTIACGTGGSNRVSAWSAGAIETYTGMGWYRGIDAIGRLISLGVIRLTDKATPKHPRYELLEPNPSAMGDGQAKAGKELIWLPKSLVMGKEGEETSPVKRLRQHGELLLLRLLVNLYFEQRMSEDGGISRRVLRTPHWREECGR